MATAQLIRPAGPLAAEGSAAQSGRQHAPLTLGVALFAVLLYAAFAHGASGTAAEARLQVALAAIAALAGGSWIWSGTLRVAAPRGALLAVGLLALFAIWSGLSLFWSVAPDPTWLELNRTLSYVLAILLAISLGASHPRSVELVAKGFLLAVLAVTVYALGQKLFPGIHVSGVFSFNQTGPLARLQEPFGYWNALGLFIAMGVPIALMLTLDRMRSRRLRLGSLIALELMLVTIGFTYSRGAVLALVVALGVGITISKAALRALMWLATACAAAAPPLIVGFSDHSLTASGVGLGAREKAGALLAGALIASLLVLLVGAVKLLDLEWRVRLSLERTRLIRRSVLGGAIAATLIVLLAVSLSSRGLGGTVSHAWRSFTTTRATSISDPHRLLSADSENRWVWWKEAAGAFSDRPVAGWGAGSFGVVHLLYRRDRLTVKQPHSVPLQWMAETGAVGAVLATCAIALLLAVAAGSVRSRPLSSERLLALALLAGVITYVVHALYDWDWDIPGVTLPPLLLMGVLAGSGRWAASERSRPLDPPSSGARAVALCALTLGLSVFAAAAVLPSLAASKASDAVVNADRGTTAGLARASALAGLAGRLDPLSDAGPKAQATIASRQGDARGAQRYLLQAVRREPTDVQAWSLLAQTDTSLGDPTAGARAVTRILMLDPGAVPALRYLAALSRLLSAPPKDSATATATP